MLWLVASAAALSAPVQPPRWAPSGAVAQATASVRIISGVRLKFGDENPQAPKARDRKVRTEDGLVRPARLIEFE
jgi:hypothetical protein